MEKQLDIFDKLKIDPERMYKSETTRLELKENFYSLDKKYQEFLMNEGMNYTIEILTFDTETNETELKFIGNINEAMCFSGFDVEPINIDRLMFMVESNILKIYTQISKTDERMMEIIKLTRKQLR